jgi:hypothetical protein
MLLRKGLFVANIDVHIRYDCELRRSATYVVRALDLTIEMPGLLKLSQPLVTRAFRQENLRIVAALKRYVEALPKQMQTRLASESSIQRKSVQSRSGACAPLFAVY